MRILILKNRFWFSGGDFTSWVQELHLGTAPGNCQALGEGRSSISSSKGGSLHFYLPRYGCQNHQWVACQGEVLGVATSGWPVKGRYWVQLSLQGLWSGVEEWGGRWMLGRGKKRKGEGSQGGGRFSRVLMLLCDWRMNLQTGPCRELKRGWDPWGPETCLELLVRAMILQLWASCLYPLFLVSLAQLTPKQQQMKVSVLQGTQVGSSTDGELGCQGSQEFSLLLS